MRPLSLSLLTLPKSGSLTSVNPRSLLYLKLHRMTPVGNSPASSIPPPFYLHSSLFLFPLSATGFATFSMQPGPASLVFLRCVTLETWTFPINPRESPAPSPPPPIFPQSPKPPPSAPFHIPHSFFAAFAVFQHNTLLLSNFTLGPSPTHALFLALISALRHAPPSLPILLFSTSLAFLSRCTDQCSLRYLPLSSSLLHVLMDILEIPDVFVAGQQFSQAWTWTGKTDWINPLQEQATHLTISWAPPLPSRDRMFAEWVVDRPQLLRRDPRRFYPTFHDDPSPMLPAFTQGILLAQSRPLQSACFQLITGHAFHADYSDHFRPTAGDTTACPHCGRRYTLSHVLLDCDFYWEARGDLLGTSSVTHLLTTRLGVSRLLK